MPTAIVDTQTNEFVPGGHVPDARYVVVELPRNPDHITEKYSGNQANPIVAKTPAEVDATKTALVDAAAGAAFDFNKLFRAKAVSDLAWRLGVAPAALTPAQIAAERTRILNIYKAL